MISYGCPEGTTKTYWILCDAITFEASCRTSTGTINGGWTAAAPAGNPGRRPRGIPAPGPLALPLAKQVRRVTALDFSEGMLELLHQEAERRGLGNITTALASWTDDWEAGGIPPHDVAIASRSLAVEDLGAALQKLERHARTAVFLSDRVGPGPFDPAAYAAVGRQLKAGPDYIYTVNLLHQMGRLPRVDYIELDEAQCFDSLDDAMEGYRWMFKDLSAQEEARLLSYLEQRAIPGPDGGLLLHRDPPPHWAFIWWTPEGRRQRSEDRYVIPAKAGIQCFQEVAKGLDTGFHRCDDFLRVHH